MARTRSANRTNDLRTDLISAIKAIAPSNPWSVGLVSIIWWCSVFLILAGIAGTTLVVLGMTRPVEITTFWLCFSVGLLGSFCSKLLDSNRP